MDQFFSKPDDFRGIVAHIILIIFHGFLSKYAITDYLVLYAYITLSFTYILGPIWLYSCISHTAPNVVQNAILKYICFTNETPQKHLLCVERAIMKNKAHLVYVSPLKKVQDMRSNILTTQNSADSHYALASIYVCSSSIRAIKKMAICC